MKKFFAIAAIMAMFTLTVGCTGGNKTSKATGTGGTGTGAGTGTGTGGAGTGAKPKTGS